MTPFSMDGHALLQDATGTVWRLHFSDNKPVFTMVLGSEDGEQYTPQAELAVGDAVKVLDDPKFCDPIYFGREGQVVDLNPDGDTKAIGVRLSPLEGENPEAYRDRKFAFKREALAKIEPDAES